MPTNAADVLDRLEQVINRLVFLEKRYVFCREALRLHPSELHVLLAVRGEPKANATRLAARLGVTKGAISQVLKRLETKGVIVKHVDSSQKNEVTVRFTPLGRDAVEDFIGQRTAVRQAFVDYLESLAPTERDMLRRFVDQFATLVPEAS